MSGGPAKTDGGRIQTALIGPLNDIPRAAAKCRPGKYLTGSFPLQDRRPRPSARGTAISNAYFACPV
jgi:hypothetical protein